MTLKANFLHPPNNLAIKGLRLSQALLRFWNYILENLKGIPETRNILKEHSQFIIWWNMASYISITPCADVRTLNRKLGVQ